MGHLVGNDDGIGFGVQGGSQDGIGVVGVTDSPVQPAVQGINTGERGQNRAGGPGVWASSKGSEGVHAETTSPVFAAVAGFNFGVWNYFTEQPANGVGVYGQSIGAGPAGFFTTAGRPGAKDDPDAAIGSGDGVLAINDTRGGGEKWKGWII